MQAGLPQHDGVASRSRSVGGLQTATSDPPPFRPHAQPSCNVNSQRPNSSVLIWSVPRTWKSPYTLVTPEDGKIFFSAVCDSYIPWPPTMSIVPKCSVTPAPLICDFASSTSFICLQPSAGPLYTAMPHAGKQFQRPIPERTVLRERVAQS